MTDIVYVRSNTNEFPPPPTMDGEDYVVIYSTVLSEISVLGDTVHLFGNDDHLSIDIPLQEFLELLQHFKVSSIL